jgi:hypothetical protein
MKASSSINTPLLLLAAAALFVGLPLAQAAHDHTMGAMATPVAAENDQAAWLAKAKEEYPLQTCVVSGDKLEDSSMGAPVDYIHKEAGKADRLVRFCCKSCVKDFKKDPAKYLKMIDDAAGKAAHAGHNQ